MEPLVNGILVNGILVNGTLGQWNYWNGKTSTTEDMLKNYNGNTFTE